MKTFLLIFLFFFNSLFAQDYKLQKAFNADFSYLLELVNDGSDKLYAVEQGGKVYSVGDTTKLFVDLSHILFDTVSSGGVFGFAFHPDYINNHYFYVNLTIDSAGDDWTKILRFVSNGDTGLINTAIEIIKFRCGITHTGGTIQFGNDGYLYISTGDGNDMSNSQLLTNMMGKMLRIDVDNFTTENNYSIPIDNPFYGREDIKQEIFAYGFRNLWKFSFDSSLIYGGDVGWNSYEEIDLINSGGNYGWAEMEGFHCVDSCDSMSYSLPLYEYNRSQGSCVMGGYVYRGGYLPELYGNYIYGDYGKGKVWALNTSKLENKLLLDTNNYQYVSFGQSINKEIYICSYNPGNIYKIRWNILGDINRDFIVDGEDLSLIDNDIFNYTLGNVPTDLNEDSIVDGSDYIIAECNL